MGILYFSFFAQVNLTTLTIAGIHFDSFDNPQAIYVFLWLFWLYFLYRFLIYFIEDEYTKVGEIWRREIRRFINPKLEKISEQQKTNTAFKLPHDYYDLKKRNWNLIFQEEIPDGGGGYEIRHHTHKIKKIELIFQFIVGTIRFTILTPAFTNYILPILLSIILFIIVGFSNWEGSIMSLVD